MAAELSARAVYMRARRAAARDERARVAAVAAKKEAARLRRNERARARYAAKKAAAAVGVGVDAEGFFGWAEETLFVPVGFLAGRRFAIPEWQREFIRAALAPGVVECGLSVARKNGKSGLIAALLLSFLCGNLNRPGWRGVVTSLTGNLASELRQQIVEIAKASELLQALTIRRAPAPGFITGARGARLDFLAADRATGHAVGADLAIIDEAGLLPESKRELVNAMLTSTSARAGGRLLCISIQGDSPMFKEMRARRGDPAVVWREYRAAASAALDDPAAWAAANPGLESGIKSLDYMRAAARRAVANSHDAGMFRAHDLNLPQAPERETIVSVADWLQCVVADDELPPRAGGCCIGFDLGGSCSMTALAALWPATGRLEVWAALPDTPNLLERGRGDAVGDLYERMQWRGELAIYPGRVTPVGDFLRDCALRLRGEKIHAAGADRYRRAEALQALEKNGIRWPVVWRGTGAGARADGAHDVRALQAAVLSGELRARESLLLESAITESAIRRDAAGNPALEKSRQAARIDALQAAVIAAGLSAIHRAKPAKPSLKLHVC